MGACLHQLLHLRNENLLSTPERQCTWSAKKSWVRLKWILWWNRAVLRHSYQPMEIDGRMKRQLCMSKNWRYSWLWKIPTNGSMVKKPHLIKNGIRIMCNTENFVPFVVPGLSSSSSGSSSSSRTPLKQESHSSSSSSSSSSSPTISEIQIRERKNGNSSDISPVHVSNSVDVRSGQPEEKVVKFWDPRMDARIHGNFGGWWNSITGRLSRQFFSWSLFIADCKETWRSG